jgi:lysophospholipase L1-like esterase
MRTLKPVLFWCLQIIIVAALLEGICFLFLKISPNPLYRARRILQSNEIWGWQAQPKLNTRFEHAPVYTDSDGFRTERASEGAKVEDAEILTLGPSSAFGWGVAAEDTYTAKLAEHLHLRYLNASQIGFSTEQGLLLWNLKLKEKLPKLKYVVVSYGINDLDRFRFFELSFTDDINFFRDRINNRPVPTMKVNSNFITTFDLFKNEMMLKINCEPLKEIKQRLSLNESKEALKRLILSLKEKNVKIIVVNTPYLRMPANPQFKYEDVESAYKNAESAADVSHCDEALSWIGKAKSIEPWRVEYDVVMLSVLQEQLSKEQGVVFIDAHAAFDRLKDQGEYFVDPVHPSAKGHDLVANLILEKLK